MPPPLQAWVELRALSSESKGLSLAWSAAMASVDTDMHLNSFALFVEQRLKRVALPVPPDLIRLWKVRKCCSMRPHLTSHQLS